jgi:hypothetical protein
LAVCELVVVIFNKVIHFSAASSCIYKSRAKKKFRPAVCRQNLLDKLAIDLREDLVHLS